MTIQLPKDLESSVRAEVLSGHFASTDDAVAEIVREYFRRRTGRQPANPAAPQASPALGSIGAMHDSADELDEIVADAMQKRREETWRVIPGE